MPSACIDAHRKVNREITAFVCWDNLDPQDEVVAYEAIGAFAGASNWANVKTLVTLGSPLGIRNLIFDRLVPAPAEGAGYWPGAIARWTNISDNGDIVALLKKLGPLFGDTLVDVRISNGATAHDISPYLTARETGKAILDGLD